MKNIKSWAMACALLLCGGALMSSCNNEEESAPTVKQGVEFSFKRKVIYAATAVNQIGSMKITLSDGTKKIELPSSKLVGDEHVITTKAFNLPEGNYEIIAYTGYDQKQNWLFDKELDTLNKFTVASQDITKFVVPIISRNALNNNFIRSALMGICLEVFGEDDTLWPWDPKEYPYPDWEGLEFELDDAKNPLYLSGIHFAGMVNGKETAWLKMTALPDGTVSQLGTLVGLTFTDMPNFKSLPSDLNLLPAFAAITCVGTGLEELPGNIGKLKAFNSLTIVNSPLKEIPAGVSELSDLRMLHIRNTAITKADISLEGLTKLESIDLSHNALISIDEKFFPTSGQLYELALDNTQLSELPASVGRIRTLHGLYLRNCKFTSIPAAAKANPALMSLHLDNNPITSFSASDLTLNVNLELLSLNGIKLNTFPTLQMPKLKALNVVDCGLSVAPNISALPELIILNAGGNSFTTLPANYFSKNTKINNISLANSPSLTTLPAGDLGLKAMVDGKQAFKWLNLEKCPALNWTTPIEWNSYDKALETYKPKTRRPDVPPGSIYDDYYGRVAVNRKGSTGVQFGK